MSLAFERRAVGLFRVDQKCIGREAAGFGELEYLADNKLRPPVFFVYFSYPDIHIREEAVEVRGGLDIVDRIRPVDYASLTSTPGNDDWSAAVSHAGSGVRRCSLRKR